MLTVILCFLIILLIVTVVFLIKILKIQIKKNNVYESWIIDYRDELESTYQKMKEIDQREIFQKDDEVGVVFSELLELINDVNQRISE